MRKGRDRESDAANSRRPTYGAATRLAGIVLGLVGKPRGRSFEAIEDEFGISRRTLLRYVAACRKELVDSRGVPMIEVARIGERQMLRLADPESLKDTAAYNVVALYFVLRMLRLLENTVLRDSVERLWDQAVKGLSLAQKDRIAHIERKFFAVPDTPKDYRHNNDQIDELVRALLQQYRLQINYQSVAGEARVHRFDPYTLVGYKGGLYLLGKSDLADNLVYLAVERMGEVKPIRNRDNKPVSFDYPRSYRPEKHTEGTFGLFDDPNETKVEILLKGDTEAYIQSRAIHPSQHFHKRKDGKTVLCLSVRGTRELSNWIMSFGPWMEVLKPVELRRKMAERLGEAAAQYRQKMRTVIQRGLTRLQKSDVSL